MSAAPQIATTQGGIGCRHQTRKNCILLGNYYLQAELEAAIASVVERYNTHRYGESLGNLTPEDIYFGRGPALLAEK